MSWFRMSDGLGGCCIVDVLQVCTVHMVVR